MPPGAEEVALTHRIDELYTAHPFYGSLRIAAQLRREGVAANRKAVQWHTREMGIAGIAPGPNTRRRAPVQRTYPYLLGSVTSAYPDHVWGIDITYVRLQGGWMYLVAILGDRVPPGCSGVVLALRRGLGTGPEPGAALRAAGGAACAGGGRPGDLEQRPGQPFHQPGSPRVLPRAPGGGGGADQHERQGPDPGLLQPRATAPASPLHPADTAYTPW